MASNQLHFHVLINICQAHFCRLAGDHVPGLECLSDGQLLPILLAIVDPDTLLSCGRANRRLHRLVCVKRVPVFSVDVVSCVLSSVLSRVLSRGFIGWFET